MVYAIALLSNLLLASAALAAPSRLEQRLARRRAGRQSQPIRLLDSGLESLASNTSHVEYSSNWAGAVWDTYPSVSALVPFIDSWLMALVGNLHVCDWYLHRTHPIWQQWCRIRLGWY